MTHAKTATILATVNLIYIAFAFIFKGYSDNKIIFGVIIFSVVLSYFLDRLILKKLSSKPNSPSNVR
jgi:hypothetical protein